MKAIAPYLKKYLPYILLAPLCISIEVVLEIYIPKIMSQIVDIGISSDQLSVVVHYGLIMVAMAVGSLIAGALSSYFSAKGGVGFGAELRKGVFEKIQDFSFENIDQFQQSSLLTRLTTDVNNIQQGLMMATRMMVRAPLMMILAAITAYTINKDLFVVFAVAIPLVAVTVIVLGNIMVPRFKAMLKKYDGLNLTVQESLTNIRTVKAYVRSDYEKTRFNRSTQELVDASIKAEKIISFMQPIMQLVIYGCIIAVLWYGGNYIMAGSMTTGELISFLSYVSQILMGLLMLAMIFIMVVQMRSSLDRIKEVLMSQALITDGPSDKDVADGSVDFNHVSFSYSQTAAENVISDINLHIRSGETLGILGATGCGKSTLVQLIGRLYDATEGTVEVGGMDVKQYKLATLRDAVAMVLQKNVLFSGTIRQNLAWGDPAADDQQIIEACRQACADEFIQGFPDGYDTDLGQGGVNLSGGQKQRLCIARALLKKPKIIILDDSTSAVDTATDSQIREALATQLKGTTTIIISQRISSVMDADRVAIIDNGRLQACASPAELLKTNAIYQDIYKTQMKGVASDAA